MNDSSKIVALITREALSIRRGRSGMAEFDILVEDVLKFVPNKYLAVNVAARRARELNEIELPVSEHAKIAKKPITQALLELIDGRLRYELLSAKPSYVEPETEEVSDTEEEVASIFEEFGEEEDFDMDALDDYDDSDDS